MTVRRKLLLWYSGVFFISSTFLVASVFALFAHKLQSDFYSHLRDEYREHMRVIQTYQGNPVAFRQAISVEVLARRIFPISIRLYDPTQNKDVLLLAPYWESFMPAVPDVGGVGDEPRISRLQIGEDREDVVYLLTGCFAGADGELMILQVGMAYKRVYKRILQMAQYMIYVLLTGLVMSVAGGWLLAGRSLDAMDEIATALEKVQAESLSKRLESSGEQDEIGRIIASVNNMLARLEQAFRQLKDFSADAAHELRTPLAAIKCRLEVAIESDQTSEGSRQVMSDLLQQVESLNGIVNNLLLLARLDASERLEKTESVDLRGILADLSEVFEVLAQQKGIELKILTGEGNIVSGNPTLLHRCFADLIENGIRYTPSGGSVSVVLTTEDGICRTVVSDTGIGIKQDDLEKIFDRFYRGEESRSRVTGGTGLGLSICRRIVELHGGSVSVKSEPGKGAIFTVDLPRMA
ncbi:MAG TPA: ATP-binding protein [Candidatus Brocadiia bacterium]|nr:ATP-binding protein [Candidatus Brocadiia bacterium]